MRNLLKIFFSAFIIAFFFSPVEMSAQTKINEHGRYTDLDEMSFAEMINSVNLGNHSDLVRKFQEKEGTNRLINGKFGPKSGCNVEYYRNKEVLVITIPAEFLFAPNDTELKNTASEYLNPIKRYLKEPDMYRVLLVMHTDNTGSEKYRDQITIDRVESVFNWFEDNNAETRFLFDYAMSDDIPLVPNTSVENRNKNRRLEIYLVPGKAMLEKAKKGRIEY